MAKKCIFIDKFEILTPLSDINRGIKWGVGHLRFKFRPLEVCFSDTPILAKMDILANIGVSENTL